MDRDYLIIRVIVFLALLILVGCFPEATEPTIALSEIAAAPVATVAPETAPQTLAESCTDSESGAILSYDAAVAIVQSSECAVAGQLSNNYSCNPMTGTWRIDLNIDQPGCLPACVVDVNEGTAEINWRCTGAIPAEDEEQVTAEPATPIAEIVTPPAEPVPGTIRDVSFEGISFSYVDRLATEVAPRLTPTEEFLMIEGAIIPSHAEFTFENYLLPDAFQQPRLVVYPINEFAAGNELVPPILEGQTQLLAEKPVKPEGSIPFLPLFNARPLMHTQINYLDFQGGEGVRYLTQFGEAYLPINNRTMFYTFQGVTRDGGYYVSLVLPVSHPSLPANEAEFSGGDEETFATNFEAYAREIEEQLDAQDETTFTPDLSMLDALVRSLAIKKELPGASPAVRYDYSGWQHYINDAFGYSFKYPANSTVEETEGDIGPAVYSAAVGGERWPIFSVNHYHSDFYRPPVGTDVRQWVLDFGIPHDAIGAELTIGGLPAVHLITEQSPGSYGFAEYYFIKDVQLFRILIWPSDGNQEWELYEQFLASFTFN